MFLFPGPGFHLPHWTGGHFCPQCEMDRLQQQRCCTGMVPHPKSHTSHVGCSHGALDLSKAFPLQLGPMSPRLEDDLRKKQTLLVHMKCACVQLTQVLCAELPHFPVVVPTDTVTEIHAGCSPPKSLCLLCPCCWLLTICLNLCQKAWHLLAEM